MILKFIKTFQISVVILLVGLPIFLYPRSVDAQKSSLANEPDATTAIIQVPSVVPDLQSAIYQVPDGGIIEVSGGTYYAPNNGLGFVIHNLGKGFTIRAAAGANVVLDGAGNRQIIHFVNTDLTLGGWVVFEGITFANGYSATDGLAGGVTMQKSQATFIDCVFRNNTSAAPLTGGGGIGVSIQSTAFFTDCEWRDNIAKNYGAGLAVEEHAAVYIHHSRFINNRTNPLGHASWAAGGGIHVGNSRLYVSNSRFENNQAGYVGGAIYARGDWNDPVSEPSAEVVIANSTFYQNKAVTNIQLNVPTEGGAVHIEDQTVAKIFNTRFILNSADTGGGVTIYRAMVEITDSVFLGNQALGVGSGNGFGGAISAISNDVPADGGQNRPSANLVIENSYIQGRYEAVGKVGQVGGGIYIAGDTARTYGILGVSQLGTVSDNRATLTMENVAIFNADVAEIPNTPGTGFGGGIFSDLSDVSVRDSIISNSDAIGSTASGGGGVAIIHRSLANIQTTTIIGNSAGKYGGGLFVQGADIHLMDSQLLFNEISPGVSESADASYGAAIFSAPDTSNIINVTGSVDNCLISGNIGLPIFEGDGTNGPINDLRYNNNQIYSTHFSDDVYSLVGVSGLWRLNVSQLNDAVVYRSNGTVTDKVQIPNIELTAVPTLGALLAVPSQVLPSGAIGDASSPNSAYLVYAWSGPNGTQLDGSPLTVSSGSIATTNTGTHSLQVGGLTYLQSLDFGVAPSATISGDTTELSWNVTQGTFLDGKMDQGISIPSVPSGSVSSGVLPDRIYRYYAVTEEGGVMVSYDNGSPLLSIPSPITVLAGLNRDKNYGSFTIFNNGGSTMNWSASTSNTWLQIFTDTGSTTDFDTVWFELHVQDFSPGTYAANISIDGGEAGSQNIQIIVILVETLYSNYLPAVKQ